MAHRFFEALPIFAIKYAQTENLRASGQCPIQMTFCRAACRFSLSKTCDLINRWNIEFVLSDIFVYLQNLPFPKVEVMYEF